MITKAFWTAAAASVRQKHCSLNQQPVYNTCQNIGFVLLGRPPVVHFTHSLCCSSFPCSPYNCHMFFFGCHMFILYTNILIQYTHCFLIDV